MGDNYSQLIERIAGAAKLAVDEVERKVDAKRAKLSGLVSKEGAAQIVAAELGIHLEKEKLKLSEIVQGMKRAHVLGKVLQIFPVRSYSKNGKEGKVANMMIADSSGNARLVLWDTNHISLVEEGKIKEGNVLEISNASVRNGELHLSSFGDIKISQEVMEGVVVEKQFSANSLGEAKAGQALKTRAFIVQVFDPRYFEVCPECGKRVLEEECKVHGKITPKMRALLNIVLDDGEGTMRAVLFGDQIKQLNLDDESIFSLEKFAEQKPLLLGEEKLFSGNVRSNQLFNTTEFTIEKVEELNVEGLLSEMENKG